MGKILVVDDERDVETLIMQRFRRAVRAGELEFLFAHDGQEALETLRAQPDIDMVLSDINMPGMDGLTLLDHLPQVNADIRAVMVSAYGDLGNVRAAMNRGAFDFIIKPIDFGDLEATIHKTLEACRAVRRLRDALQETRTAEAASRAQAARLRRVLDEFVVDGVKTTLPLFQELVSNQDIANGEYDIHWLENYLAHHKAQ